jgi:cephalosporin-C deacetylase
MSLDPLLRPDVPADFAEFWRSTVAEAMAAPLEITLDTTAGMETDGHRVRTFTFRGIDGRSRHGWWAQPFQDQIVPGFLWLAPYSRWSMQPDTYGTRPGMASVSFNFHGEGPFHRETYTPERGYFADGVDRPETWVFRRMFQDAVLVARHMTELPGIDGGRLGAMGMSQGGGISIWMGAWVPLIRAVVADMPFLGGMPWVLSRSAFRYPLKELTDWLQASPEQDAAGRSTIRYFDTVNQATECRVPTRVSLGLKDPAVRPEQVRAIFDALPGEKELDELDWGHDWHPQMVESNRAWLLRHLR